MELFPNFLLQFRLRQLHFIIMRIIIYINMLYSFVNHENVMLFAYAVYSVLIYRLNIFWKLLIAYNSQRSFSSRLVFYIYILECIYSSIYVLVLISKPCMLQGTDGGRYFYPMYTKIQATDIGKIITNYMLKLILTTLLWRIFKIFTAPFTEVI